jgi:thiol-disulfide isomerase/thioredoxin
MAKAKSRKSTSSQRQAQQRRQPAATRAAQSQASAPSASQQRPQSAADQANQPQAQVRTSALQQRKQQQARSNQRKRVRSKSNWRPAVTVGVVLLIIAGIIGVFLFVSRQSAPPGPAPTPVNSSVLQAVTHVDPTVLAAVGTGGTSAPQALHGQPLLKGPTGKPEFFYFGAEYCPYCAAQRWGIVVALSRFGTFSHLNQTTSSSTDVYPNTPTFTFYQSSYSSPYIDFVSVESEDRQQNPLQTPTAEQQQIFSTYDAPPYVSAQDQGAFPFIDIANQHLVSGSSYLPNVLQGLNWQEIAYDLSNQDSPVTKGILGTANYLTAAICQATNQQPVQVCGANPIPQIEQSLGKAGVGTSGTQLGLVEKPFEAVVRRPGRVVRVAGVVGVAA